MEHAHAALPRLPLDGKRIVATSGVIALHAGLLMMLMMPPQLAPTQAEEEVIVLPDWEKPHLPPPPPPPPPKDVVKPRPQQTVAPVQLPIPEPVVEPVDQSPGPMDIAVTEEPPVSNSFDVGQVATEFRQLTPDVSPAPPYPRQATARRIEGTVVLRLRVDATGKPVEVSIERSSGSAILDEAALKFIKARWHFVPAQQDGQAIEAWALLPIEFVLQ